MLAILNIHQIINQNFFIFWPPNFDNRIVKSTQQSTLPNENRQIKDSHWESGIFFAFFDIPIALTNRSSWITRIISYSWCTWVERAYNTQPCASRTYRQYDYCSMNLAIKWFILKSFPYWNLYKVNTVIRPPRIHYSKLSFKLYALRNRGNLAICVLLINV